MAYPLEPVQCSSGVGQEPQGSLAAGEITALGLPVSLSTTGVISTTSTLCPVVRTRLPPKPKNPGSPTPDLVAFSLFSSKPVSTRV